MDNDVINYK